MSGKRTFEDESIASRRATSEIIEERLSGWLHRRSIRSAFAELAIGAAAALIAVAVRYALPLSPEQLPTLTVVIALSLTSMFVGVRAGITTAVVGGLLAWYIFFTPFSWEVTPEGAIPLIGFWAIATVIVATSHLYRLSIRRSHDVQVAALKAQAETADLFARELAHRLKNALMMVQSIASQTLDRDSPETNKFVARLKTLADSHDLLSEHVDTPMAEVPNVVDAALKPFTDERAQVQVTCPQTQIAAQQALLLALALHELGTNASKYGALSTPGGRVSLAGEDLGDQIKLVWKEEGGPSVVPPTATGFGTRFLRRLGMGTEVQYEPDGVRASLILQK